MGKIYALTRGPVARRRPTGRRSGRALHFTRSELHQLLSLYSRRVARGEWRDYAIDQDGGLAAFSVFRHSHERPLYTITKRWSAPGQSVEYLVLQQQLPLGSGGLSRRGSERDRGAPPDRVLGQPRRVSPELAPRRGRPAGDVEGH